eukprot:18294-Pelagomonas_calceolata.AAC.4
MHQPCTCVSLKIPWPDVGCEAFMPPTPTPPASMQLPPQSCLEFIEGSTLKRASNIMRAPVTP